MTRRDIALQYFDSQRSEIDARINRGIELYRKGNAVLTVTDSDGNRLCGARIRAKLKNHEFRFGANLFMLDEFESAEKNAVFRSTFPELFNLATLPFYWKTIEPTRGQYRFDKSCPRIYRRPSIDLCLEYCEEQGIEPKAHCLNYDYFRPEWIKGATVEEHKALLENHFRVLSERYADRIPSWEVTNETFNDTFAREFIDGLYSEFYRKRDFNSWSFLTSDKYFPNNKLIINDHLDFGCMRSLHGEYFGERSPYFMEIERILSGGVSHLDSIGFQYHCFFKKEMEAELSVTRYNPSHIFDVLDTYERLGKKLQITEMTVSAFSGDIEDEEVQAELLLNLYRVFFSHPAFEAVIYWNLVDGYASGGKPGNMALGENIYYGGLMRFDMTKKPAYKALYNLIHKEWHTDTEVVTDEGGVASFRGFYGDYDIKVVIDGKEYNSSISLSSRASSCFEVTI